MRTQMLNENGPDGPSLEYVPAGETQPCRCPLREFPFTIGRDPAADLPVDSNRVSRQHAQIVRTPEGGFLVRDMHSTNGTCLNGSTISESPLIHGDVLRLADIDFTFYCDAAVPGVAVTQVMTQPASNRPTDTADLILQVRRLHESLTHRSISSRFQPIVELSTGQTFGYQAIRWIDDTPSQHHSAESIIAGTECRLTERIHQQHRLVAAELARRLAVATHLFLPLQVSEVQADFMPDCLGQLTEIVDHRHQLVAEIPETAACDIPYFRQFVQRLRARDIEIAYAGYCSGPNQLADWGQIAPNYLKLAPALVRGISRASGGWRKAQALLQATQQLNCEVIAVGVDDEADAQCLAELGYRFGQGARYGGPQSLSALQAAQPALAPAAP